MPDIRPISDLRNYGDVLGDVTVGAPVYLTKNGRGKYALMDLQDLQEVEKMKATMWLQNELILGMISGENKGWLSLDAVEKMLNE